MCTKITSMDIPAKLNTSFSNNTTSALSTAENELKVPIVTTLCSEAERPDETDIGKKKLLLVHRDDKIRDRPKKLRMDHETTPCQVCGAKSSQLNFGISTCRKCSKFFRRHCSMSRCRKWKKNCIVSHDSKIRCNFCWMQKCRNQGMISKSTTSRKKKKKRSSISDCHDIKSKSKQRKIGFMSASKHDIEQHSGMQGPITSNAKCLKVNSNETESHHKEATVIIKINGILEEEANQMKTFEQNKHDHDKKVLRLKQALVKQEAKLKREQHQKMQLRKMLNINFKRKIDVIRKNKDIFQKTQRLHIGELKETIRYLNGVNENQELKLKDLSVQADMLRKKFSILEHEKCRFKTEVVDIQQMLSKVRKKMDWDRRPADSA